MAGGNWGGSNTPEKNDFLLQVVNILIRSPSLTYWYHEE
jgi:hypothetical protein